MVTEAPHPVPGWARGWHLATFVVAVAGLLLQLWLSATHPLYPGRYSTPILLWNVLSYFTVWSNIVVAVACWLLFRDPTRRGPGFAPFRLAGLTMITVTGLIYGIVLARLWQPVAWYKVADQTLHYLVPALAVLGYLLFGPRPLFSPGTLARSLLVR